MATDDTEPSPIPPTIGAFAIVPSNDLSAALPFWHRLGFMQTGGEATYVIMTGWGCEVHLTQAGGGPWRVPAEHNPFGVFIRTPAVEAIAAQADDLIIRPGGVLRHRDWGMYEVAFAGPDGLLVRVGWPSRFVRGKGSEGEPTPAGRHAVGARAQ